MEHMRLKETPTHKKMNPNIDLTQFIKINSNLITALNVKCRTVKLITENLDDHGYDFLNTTPKVKSTKEMIEKLDFIKIKIFCSGKHNVKRMGEGKGKYWEKIQLTLEEHRGLEAPTHYHHHYRVKN